MSRSWKIGFDAWWREQTKMPDSKFVCYEEVMRPMMMYHQLCCLHLMPHMQSITKLLFLKVLWKYLWKNWDTTVIFNHCPLEHVGIIHHTVEQQVTEERNAQLDIFVCKKKRKVWKIATGEQYSINDLMSHCTKSAKGDVR